MIRDEIFIAANVSFGIQLLSQNNSGWTFLFQLQFYYFFDFLNQMQRFGETKTLIISPVNMTQLA